MPRKYGKAKQTRLSFNPVGSVSASASAAQENTQRSPGVGEQKDREATLRYGHPSMPNVTRHRKPRLDFDQASRKQRRKSSSPSADIKSSDTEGESPFAREQSPKAAGSGDDHGKGKPAPRSKSNDTAIALDSDSDLEIAPNKQTKRDKKSSKRKRSATPEQEEPSQHQSEEESDADEIVTRPRRKLRRGAASKPTVISDKEEDDHVSKKKKEDEEEEDEPIIATPVRRKRNVALEDPQTPLRGSDQDQLDIEEDLADLQDSGMMDR